MLKKYSQNTRSHAGWAVSRHSLRLHMLRARSVEAAQGRHSQSVLMLRCNFLEVGIQKQASGKDKEQISF